MYIYNPNPFHFSKKIFTLQKKYMFENLVGHEDMDYEHKALLAQGYFIGKSHYVVILYSSSGRLLDVNVSDLTETIF
jgi:hypothetical protein